MNDNFSKDADQTRYIKYLARLCGGVLGILFGVEVLAMVLMDSKSLMVFTNELNHVLINASLMGFVGSGAYLWGKAAGEREANGEKKNE